MKSLSPLFGGDTLAFGKAVIKQYINYINTESLLPKDLYIFTLKDKKKDIHYL